MEQLRDVVTKELPDALAKEATTHRNTIRRLEEIIEPAEENEADDNEGEEWKSGPEGIEE